MQYKLSPRDMKKMIEVFTAHHVDGVYDDIGPNKPDAPFFDRLAGMDEISEVEYQEAAERFYKYRNTQMRYMMRAAGISDSVDIVKFLEHMTELGIKAKAKKASQSKLRSQLRRFFKKTGEKPKTLNEVIMFDGLHSIEELLSTNVSTLFSEYGMTKEEMHDLYTETLASYIVDEAQQIAHATVKAQVYEDVWYGGNDTAKRWPKKSKRISLKFPRHARCKDELKNQLGFPALKWNGEFWSLAYTKEAIEKCIPIFEKHGFITDQIKSIDTPTVSTKPVVDVTATLQGDTVVLKWPWLDDSDLRTKVMGIVKGVMGRKWDGGRKAWLIPVSQAPFLKGRLDGIYQALADAIANMDGMDDVLENTAERISLSSAAELTDADTIADMKDRLSKQFPEGRELYPFQYVGVRFAELAGGRALIGDDMGVGKTIQAIAYSALHPENHPVLVVCPANVKYNWVKEFNTWLPNLTTEAIKNGKSVVPDSDVVVINYDLMKKKQLDLEERGFNICIFDESHYLKNSKAQRTIASLDLARTCKDILCLSGTAITNRPIEFFTTLNLLRPTEFGNFFAYAKRYCDAEHNGWGWDFKGSSNEVELHERTRAFGIRRLKKEVMAELPDKIRQIVYVEPSTKDKREYNNVQRTWMNQYQMLKASGDLPAGFVLNMLTELRHHCGLLKVNATVNWVKEYNEMTGKPVIIFAHHKDVVDSIIEELKGDLSIGRITGDVPAEKRQERVDAFQQNKIDVMVCSTVAAKEGLTLTAADTVVFVEREWTPAWEEQAEDRVNRIGQDAETVHAVYLSVAGTIDEKFNTVVEEKRAVISSILDGGDVIERQGIAKALLQSMVDAGDLPAELIRDLGVGGKE